MKKLCFFLCFLALSAIVRAQSANSQWLLRSGNTYIIENQVMHPGVKADNDYARFLQGKCPAAYVQWEQGRKTAVAGWVLLGIGAGLDIGSYVWALCDLNYTTASRAMGIVGLGCELACIPTLIVGYTKMHNSADMYNALSYQQQSVAYWSVNAGPEGLGLAYHF
ncbi:MAG: hypothetical protein MJZ82_02290 [Paludibacteraceae bacterium]|nr:hypothetical protein [Paludibacteraceae bacterium]